MNCPDKEYMLTKYIQLYISNGYGNAIPHDVYFQVNCISTEFTAKKHGGEKGVPFRLQVETRETDEEDAKLVHCASCQIKVFKVTEDWSVGHSTLSV